MRILIISDTHYGARGDNKHFYPYQKKFLHKVVFPYIDKFKIKTLVHLGDLVENRKSINYLSLNTMKEDFLSNVNIDSYWIPGNHDAFYTSTLSLNAMSEHITRGTVFTDPTTIDLDGSSILFVPWICRDNREACIDAIRSSTARFLFGHLEVKGFLDNSDMASTHGEDRSLFQNFDLVLSGHYHQRSRQDNIRYVGAPFAFNWGDYNQYRGFSVFDTDTGDLVYYRNPYSIFSVVTPDETKLERVKDTYCRVILNEPISDHARKELQKKIEDIGIIQLTFDDKYAMATNCLGEVAEGEGLQEIAMRHIDSLPLSNPTPVKEKFLSLMRQAQQETMNDGVCVG